MSGRGVVDAVVVGAGVSGLTTAVVLQDAGWRVEVVTADEPAATTSMIAAAVWFPTLVGPRDRVLVWGERTRHVLERIGRDHPGAGVVPRETLSLYRGDPGRPWWIDALGDVASVPPSALPAGYSHGLRYRVPLAEMPIYLPWLLDRFVAAGGSVEQRQLLTLDEVAGRAPVVVNCAGLGARELVGDRTLEAVRGQVVRTTNPGLTVSLRDEHHPEGYTYIHPRSRDVVLGGTLEPGEWDTVPDETVGARILERCRSIVPELREATVTGQAVGLRPARETVRLERDPEPPAGVDLVHNYGHGGAGITLSWGCAEEVARIVGVV